jgi:plasmid stabilization system protein ParE
LKVTYAEEAIADIVEAMTFLNERNPTAAASLDDQIARCIERLAAQEFEGPISTLRSVLSSTAGLCRRSVSTTNACRASC